MTKKELREQALALPRNERAKLAHEIIASLEDAPDEGAAKAWIQEIERRAREVKSGKVVPIDWDTARARIQKRLSAGR